MAKIIKLQPKHNIPKSEELKGKTYCKYHNSNKHTTNNCIVFRDAIQSWIDKGKLKFPEKKMIVNVVLFPSTTVGMVDAHLPKNKGKGKAEFVPIQHVPKQISRARLMIDLFSNEPLTKFLRPAIVKSMSNSSTEEAEGPMVLCSCCKAYVVLTKPKEKLPQALTSPQPSKAATTSPKKLGKCQSQKVFNKLSHYTQADGPPSARQRLNFDEPFYNEDYYSRNSSSSSSSMKQKTFKPPEPRNQRWYSYNSPTGMYTALS
ncbi:hypothetical protein ACFX16_013324 [Malus domestica]